MYQLINKLRLTNWDDDDVVQGRGKLSVRGKLLVSLCTKLCQLLLIFLLSVKDDRRLPNPLDKLTGRACFHVRQDFQTPLTNDSNPPPAFHLHLRLSEKGSHPTFTANSRKNTKESTGFWWMSSEKGRLSVCSLHPPFHQLFSDSLIFWILVRERKLQDTDMDIIRNALSQSVMTQTRLTAFFFFLELIRHLWIESYFEIPLTETFNPHQPALTTKRPLKANV